MQTICVSELKKLLDNHQICLIDVREPDEYQAASIEKAHLIPLAQLCREALPPHSGPIAIHCHSGKRSAVACEKLLTECKDLEVYSVDGGIVAWIQAGFDVKKND